MDKKKCRNILLKLRIGFDRFRDHMSISDMEEYESMIDELFSELKMDRKYKF